MHYGFKHKIQFINDKTVINRGETLIQSSVVVINIHVYIINYTSVYKKIFYSRYQIKRY